LNDERKIKFVTGNLSKFQEAKLILSEYDLELEMEKTKMPEIQNDDIEIIAKTSVKEAQKRVSGPIIVEDAGLFINELNGFPGPYSAYVHKTLGCKWILKILEGVEDRTAEFKSAIAYLKDVKTPTAIIFQGIVKGEISREMCGDRGFGFDPIFIPEKLDRTFGEIRLEEKSKYSHRAMALKGFASWYIANI
tara:strand:+ start:341 stop:916 length:576 start_codon:yes stop_codon:yes gene_type:complete